MAELAETHAAVPSTERGRGILVSADPRTPSIVYCNGRTVFIRRLDNPLEVDVYKEHSAPVSVARFSPNGEWVASGDAVGNVRIWARAGPEHTLKYEYRALSGRIDDLEWSPDGQRIVVSGDGKGKAMVRAFMWDTGTNVGSLDGHSKRVLSCTFRPVRPFRVATGGEDFLVNYYEGPPFRFKTSHRDHSNFVNCVRFSPDGSKFITTGSDKKGFLYSGQTGEKIGGLLPENGHAGSIYAASWSPDGKQVLTVSADKTAKVWDILEDGNGKVNTTFKFSGGVGAEDMQVGCLWLKDYLISISLGGSISYLSCSDPSSPQRTLSGHMKNITAVTVSMVGGEAEIFSSSYDGVISRWICGAGYKTKLETKNPVHVKAMVAAGESLVTCGLDNKLRRSPLPGDTYGDAEIADLKSQPKDLDVALNFSELAIVTSDAGVILLRECVVVSTNNLRFTATASAISPDGSEAVIGNQDGKLYIYSVKGDALVEEKVLEHHRGAVTSIRFSPDGSMFASGDANREAVVWDRVSHEIKLKNMLYHTARITCLAWSPDSRKVATGSVDTNILVYDIEKPVTARTTIKGAHLGGVNSLVFKDACNLVSGGDDACVRVWHLL
eukprot:c24332_g1_i1 orf=148-1977(-)